MCVNYSLPSVYIPYTEFRVVTLLFLKLLQDLCFPSLSSKYLLLQLKDLCFPSQSSKCMLLQQLKYRKCLKFSTLYYILFFCLTLGFYIVISKNSVDPDQNAPISKIKVMIPVFMRLLLNIWLSQDPRFMEIFEQI